MERIGSLTPRCAPAHASSRDRAERLLIGYHGCSAEAAERILAGYNFKPSENEYDWLGRGIYFWEFGLDRAWRWARDSRNSSAAPAVVGAIIQLGNCFDLMDTRFTKMLADVAPAFVEKCGASGMDVPINRGTDMKGRYLDCALINFSLDLFAEADASFQCVRCGFVEGDPVFAGESGIVTALRMESHVQIAVTDPRCILGVFRPMG